MWLEGHLIESGQPVRLELKGGLIGRIEPLTTAPRVWIAAGLLDIQVNGYAGHDVNAPDVTAAVIVDLAHTLWQRGVNAFCPTIISESETRMCRSLSAVAAACEADPLIEHTIPCIHVEGPYISSEDGPRGAHPREHIRMPDLAEYRRWQEAAGGRIGIITLAPELPGACEYIRAVSADNVCVAIGHTAADEEQISAAILAGARFSTHLGNGAHAQLKRHPNYIWTQMAEDRLMATLICDGHHLAPAVMKTMLRAKGCERSILISDATAVGGLPPGIYKTPVGGKVELLAGGRLNLYGTSLLAGSASLVPDAISNVIRYAGLSLTEAVRLVSANPARLLGLDVRTKRGTVRSGATADLTLFQIDPVSAELMIDATIVRGEVVYRRQAWNVPNAPLTEQK